MSLATPVSDAQHAFANVEREVAGAAPSERIYALQDEANYLGKFVAAGRLDACVVCARISEVGALHGLPADKVEEIAHSVFVADIVADPEPPYEAPRTAWPGDSTLWSDAEPGQDVPLRATLKTITPADWKGTVPVEQGWLSRGRIPSGDLTILSGNGGAGKSEIAIGLVVSVAAGLNDWLGSIVESGPALFLSGEEEESNIRDRVERICRHRGLDPDGIADAHFLFPELDATWLCSVDLQGRIVKTSLLLQIEAWIAEHKPALVVIDSVAAVFDGDAINRRQVRGFLAVLRKVAREHGTAVVLLDHPSVRGMADGSGTANSVDWRNSVRSMLHLSDPAKSDPDSRILELKKSNRGRSGEKIELRWNGLTFSTGSAGTPSAYRAAAERDTDELFLQLLDKRNAQGRRVHANNAKGSAPSEFAMDPDAGRTTAEGFRAAMERLLKSGRIAAVETGPQSKRRSYLCRATR